MRNVLLLVPITVAINIQYWGANKPQGAAKRLSKAQNRSLRIVAGVYKTTPILCLETETWVPPLDLYFNKRLADLESQLQLLVL
jgi:hypothetical protein